MLNPFPDLFFLGAFLSPLLLRVILGIFLINTYQVLYKKTDNKKQRAIAGVFVIVGIMLIIGFYTQIASLVVMALTVFVLWQKITQKETLSVDEKWLAIFIIIIACSLLFSGAGGFAMDIPL